MTTETRGTDWRRLVAPPLILLAVVAGLSFTWYSAHSLLMLFAGILFAVFLDACTRGLAHVLPVARRWRFGLVVMALEAFQDLGDARFPFFSLRSRVMSSRKKRAFPSRHDEPPK